MDEIVRLIPLIVLGGLFLFLLSVALQFADHLIRSRRCKPDENGRIRHDRTDEGEGIFCQKCGRLFDPGPYVL